MFVSRLLPAEFGNKEKLEAQLREKLRTAEKLIDYALQNSICPMRFLKKNFRQGDDNYLVRVEDDRQKLNVFYRIDKYIRDKRDMVQETTLTTIRCIKKHLLGFEDYQKKAITFDCSNVKSYGGLLKYLTYEAPLLRRNRIIRGLKVNTIGKTIKHLKSFLKDRMERKIIPFMDLSFFNCMEEEVDAVYLSWDELSKIYHLDLSLYPYPIKYRDLFVLDCLTGLRFSDYSNIQSDELRNGMLYIVQRKTLLL
ncbi:MAG TPA: phage integrase SAM-like domain-containing protein [Chitinophagaceae bacterium]